MAHSESKPRDRFVHVRYRPYNILQSSKKIIKLPIKVQNGHEPSNRVQKLQGGREVSKSPPLQQHRVYDSGFKQRIRIKKDLIETCNSRTSNTQQSQNSDANDS